METLKFAYIIEPPFNDRTPDGSVIGCDVELACTILRDRLGMSTELVETEFAELIPGLAQGRWDMTTAMFATPARQTEACFSRPIWALTDGLLVAGDNPLALEGYRSVAHTPQARLAVLHGQEQRSTAQNHGVSDDQLVQFESYRDAAEAVRAGTVDAYASVARAHAGFLATRTDWALDIVAVPQSEKPPAFGSFVFARQNTALRDAVNRELDAFLGSTRHREMVAVYGFTDTDVDLLLA
ncbi:MAG: transporter substrate-binding domain-containing protein [Pseudomonadota bacterium]